MNRTKNKSKLTVGSYNYNSGSVIRTKTVLELQSTSINKELPFNFVQNCMED